ncbi:cyclin T1 L homeolog [Xenopus laevis]|uniref:Cyclin T1 L homeolog n=1 Tax=Xenopus laevis TaxID=8355 RepID=Q32NI5_XENLA|nr:cyclin T1 L homeolog [Xenopus laevis]AAI08608.1 MGC131149 protein [Xenopus laevis]
MATNSLHLTTFSLQYTPPVVACVCIHLACKWSNWEIPVSTDGKPWWEYVDVTVDLKLLDELTHEFLQILEKTPNRLKRIRNWRISQATKKPKEEECEEESDNIFCEQTLLQMFSQSGMLNSASLSDSSSQTLSVTENDGGMSEGQWGCQLQSERDQHRTGEHVTSTEQSQALGSKPVPLAKMSLKEYRAKHADELAAQKRQLEQLGTSLKEQYACAAQNLLQQQKEREKEAHASPIILKIPLHEVSHKRSEKSSSLKLRIPVTNREKSEEGKVRIKLPNEDSSKSRDKHRSSYSSSHHNNQSHRQHHQEPSGSNGSKLPPPVVSTHKSSSSSRKRPATEEATGHEPPSHKVSRTSKPSSQEPAVPLLLNRVRGTHSKTERESSGTNGHSITKVIDYQDTVNMLHSLLSAQGVQPMQPPQYLNQFGEFRRTRPGNTDDSRRPPLPAEPPPPLPPLPK